MIESDFDRMVRRAESLYGERKDASDIPAVYLVTPPNAPKPDELEEAKALIVSFLRAIPEVLLTLAALQLLLVREGWRWLRQWKRVAKSD
jgi:hypothetical protein